MESIQAPIVSVIMATFNRADFIGGAIQSVIEQTMTDWELIVVDDGSTDSTSLIVAEWVAKDSRIRYIPIPHAGRIAIVSNVALQAARGRYVAILDDDDAWIDPEKLEKQTRYLDNHPDCVVCAGGYRIVTEENVSVEDVLKPESDSEMRHVALRANPIANSTAMFRRSIGQPYDTNLAQFADWDFWLKLGMLGTLYNFPEIFLAYRVWNRGSSFVNQRANAVSAIEIVERYRKAYPGYIRAILIARAYWVYTFLPVWMRRYLNSFLSRLKKRIYSKAKKSEKVPSAQMGNMA